MISSSRRPGRRSKRSPARRCQRLRHRGQSGDGRAIDARAINAGLGLGGAFVGGTNLRDQLTLLQLNVIASVHLAKRALPAMVERCAARVLITAPVETLMPGAFEAIYAASKAFLLSFGEALQNELRESSVTLTILLPGAIDTPIFHRAQMADSLIARAPKDAPEEVAR